FAARAAHGCGRGCHGVDVRARAQRHSAGDWTSLGWVTCRVGVPRGLAPPYARRPGLPWVARIDSETSQPAKGSSTQDRAGEALPPITRRLSLGPANASILCHAALRQGGCQVRAPEVIALEQNRLARGFGKGIGEAVAKIQPGRVPAPLAEIAIGFARNPRLGFGNRLDDDIGLLKELVKPPAGHRIAASINHDCGLDVIDCRNATAAGAGNRLGIRRSFRLIAKDGDERGRIDNHRGSPFSLYNNSP